MKTLSVTILILLLSSPSIFAQLDYSPQAVNKDSAVKMHLAMRLLRGDLSKPQEDFIRQGIRDRRSISETEAKQLFSTTELRDIFFGIGREDVSTFKSMFDKESITDKKAIYSELPRDQKIDARRTNFAWGIGYLNLNDPQIDYLIRLSKAMPTITRKQGDEFELEAISLFPGDEGKLMFGSIGPFTPQKCKSTFVLTGYRSPTAKLFQPNACICSVGSSFNLSCNGECTLGGSRCTTQQDGCGFAWLYSCNGLCQQE